MLSVNTHQESDSLQDILSTTWFSWMFEIIPHIGLDYSGIHSCFLINLSPEFDYDLSTSVRLIHLAISKRLAIMNSINNALVSSCTLVFTPSFVFFGLHFTFCIAFHIGRAYRIWFFVKTRIFLRCSFLCVVFGSWFNEI